MRIRCSRRQPADRTISAGITGPAAGYRQEVAAVVVRAAVDTIFDEVLTAGIAGAVALRQRVAEVKAAVLTAQEVDKVVALSGGVI